MIKQRYEEAVVFHGHRCPGLALGVRAAWEAQRRLGTDMVCVAESINCTVDGIQSLLGCTFGNGKLLCRPTGKCAFSFYDTNSGESFRVIQRKLPQGLDMEEKIDLILTAPLEQVFVLGSVRRPLRPKTKRAPALVCEGCGETADEDKMRRVNGQNLCLDCAEEA